MHRLPERFLTRPVDVVVVGCGGTGSVVAGGLPYLHQSMLAFGHPYGLHVTLIDGDTISETNCVRQPFTRAEVGLHKAVVLATRVNLFWGLEWEAIAGYVGADRAPRADLVIGCVDTRKARRAIIGAYDRIAHYWLDFGNDAYTGQVALGEFPRAHAAGTSTARRFAKGDRTLTPFPRLPTSPELWPEIVDDELDQDDGPSCSAQEALTRQGPFVNQVLGYHGLALLGRLFRFGEIAHHGAWINLTTGRVSAIPVPAPPEAEAGEDADAETPADAAEGRTA